MNGKNPSKPSASTGSTSSGSSTSTSGGKEHTRTGFGGKYQCTVSALNVRTAPDLSASVVAKYTKGQTVTLDDWYKINDGLVWGRYTGGTSGKKRYVAVGKPTGKAESSDYLIKVGKSPSSSSKKSNATIAKEIIAGKWGNGDTRKKKLQAAGYDYNAIQKLVNQML